MSTRKPAFVLVHGAWHSAATWRKLVPILDTQGHAARKLDLPGAGVHARMPRSYDVRPLDGPAFSAEASPNAAVTQEQRTSAAIALVQRTVRETGGPVVLLGHSLGGLTVGAVAEAIPEHLHAIVYLSAFMLPSGMTAMDQITQPSMAGAQVKGCILADPQTVGAMRIDFRSTDRAYRDRLRTCFAADVSEAAFDGTRVGLHCDEPLAVFLTPVAQTASRFGQVPRHYVRCLDDRAIPLAGQNAMIAAVDAGLSTRTQVHDLSTSHSPFQAQPAGLADLLTSIAAQPGLDPIHALQDRRSTARIRQGEML